MRSKYNNKKTKVNGITFDSKAEAAYYEQLLEQKKAGEIKDFELQPKFLLQPALRKNGQTFRAIHYIADFKVINNDGSVAIIDVKGVETEAFKIKRKLFEERFPDLSLQLVKGGAGNGRKRARAKTAAEKEKAKQRAERKKKSRERRVIQQRI